MKKIENLKKNKSIIILTSIIILLPMLAGILLWPRLPERMATHFGTDNTANGWSSKGFAVFGLPLFCLFIHLICIGATLADPKQKGIPDKVFKMITLIAPLVSLLSAVTIYGYALNLGINIGIVVNVFVGILFVLIGYYLPKCRQNYTVGIKLPWTLDNEDNWNRTHKLAGRLWVLCGLFVIVNAFLNIGGTWSLLLILVVMTAVPAVYSFIYYLQNEK